MRGGKGGEPRGSEERKNSGAMTSRRSVLGVDGKLVRGAPRGSRGRRTSHESAAAASNRQARPPREPAVRQASLF